MGALDGTRGGLGGHPFSTGAISRGAIPRPGGDTFRLRRPPTLRGRINVAMPSGVVLPEVSGGVAPYTYSISGNPAGTTFTAGTRTLSGTPTASGDSTVTYSVEDSSTPAKSTSVQFSWSVLGVLSTDPIMLQDFDDGKVGYGVSNFNFVWAATLISGRNLGFTNASFWQSAPRGVLGSEVDDPYQQRLLPTGGIISRLQYYPQSNPDQFRVSDSNVDLAGNPVDSDIGAWASATAQDGLNLYLQTSNLSVGVTLNFGTDIQSTADWHMRFNLSNTESTWVRNNLNEDNEFLMVIA